MKRFLQYLFLVAVVAIMGYSASSCDKADKITGPVVIESPSMEWYASHIDTSTVVLMDDMITVVNAAYAAHPDSAIGQVRQAIWTGLQNVKREKRTASAFSVESYSIFTLNWQEQLLLMSEPWNAIPTNDCKNAAVNEANRLWPGYSQFQDKADGFRHAYWNILMSKRIYEDWARRFSTAHEYGAVNGLLDAQMDLNNNGIGRALWRSYGNSRSEGQYSSIVKGWQYVKVTSFSNAVPYIIYLVGN